MPSTTRPFTASFTPSFTYSFARFAALAAATLAMAGAHAATVEVSFAEPDKFTDAGRGSFETDRTTKALTEIFEAYGKKLPQGQTLKVVVTDVDLAGEMRFSHRATRDIRVLRGRADWPRVDLRFTLSEGSGIVKAGEARLSDMTYLQHALAVRYREPYGYEARMIDRWFADTFMPATASR